MKKTMYIIAAVVALAVVLFSLEANRRADAERFDASQNAAQAAGNMKIRKATEQEKREWAAKKELYPLFGFVSVSTVGTKQRIECAVEYLGEGPGEPNYEAHAPNGMHFYDGDALHTMLGSTQADLINRLGHLQECTPETCDVESDGTVRAGR